MEQGPFCRRAGQRGGSAHFGGHTPAIVEFAAVGSSCETGGTVWATLENTGDTRSEEAEIELWYQGLDTTEAEMLVDSQVLFPLEPGDATTVLLSTSPGSGRYAFTLRPPDSPDTGAVRSEDIDVDLSLCETPPPEDPPKGRTPTCRSGRRFQRDGRW